MASLYEIMREQEDEKLARQLYAQNALYQKEEELFNSELSDEELARRLQEQYGGFIEQHLPEKENKEPAQETDEELARRLQEEFDRADNGQQVEDGTAAQVDPAEFELEDDETAALQYEEDERLAYEMQNFERSEVRNVHPRQFNAVEERYATLKPLHFDENGDEPDDEYYQELEDQDIAFVYRRFPEKLNAQSDEPKALHHQTYSTRNSGKGEDRTKRQITKAGRELIKQFRVKEDGFEYGVVLGQRHDQAYCYDGLVRKVHFYKKIRSTTLITRGALVLLKLRPYQDDIADVVHIYEKEEVNRLYEIGEITQLDPILHLPPEVLHTVLEHLNSERTTLSLLNRTWNTLVQEDSADKSDRVADLNDFAAQVDKITWGNLSNFHNRFVRGAVVRMNPSQYFCAAVNPRSAGRPNQAHFLKCDLTDEVLDVANAVWNKLQASRGIVDPENGVVITAYDSDDGNDDDDSHSTTKTLRTSLPMAPKCFFGGNGDDSSDDDDVLGLGLPSDKAPSKASRKDQPGGNDDDEVPGLGLNLDAVISRKDKPLFTKDNVLRLNFEHEELINYAATVLWTWWIIHKRKDLDQRPDTIDVPIRATLLRMLLRGVEPTVRRYEHSLERAEDKKSEEYLTTKRKLAAFKSHWDLVLNPPPYWKRFWAQKKEAQFSDEVQSSDDDF